MNLDTEITTIQEITGQSIERFRQEQWQKMDASASGIDRDGCRLGDYEAFITAQTRAETFLERARWAFPIALEMMAEVANTMSWPWITPVRWTWFICWGAELLIGYVRERVYTADGQAGTLRIRACTAEVGIDVWGEAYAHEPDWVPDLAFCFADQCQVIPLSDDLVGDEARLRELCAAAIIEAYRVYALSDEFVPPL